MAGMGREVLLTEIETEVLSVFVKRKILGNMAIAGLLDGLIMKLIDEEEANVGK